MTDDDAPPPKLMPPAFWIAILFGAAMILAGAAVAWLAPHRPGPAPPPKRPAALTGPMTRGKGPAV